MCAVQEDTKATMITYYKFDLAAYIFRFTAMEKQYILSLVYKSCSIWEFSVNCCRV